MTEMTERMTEKNIMKHGRGEKYCAKNAFVNIYLLSDFNIKF